MPPADKKEEQPKSPTNSLYWMLQGDIAQLSADLDELFKFAALQGGFNATVGKATDAVIDMTNIMRARLSRIEATQEVLLQLLKRIINNLPEEAQCDSIDSLV